MKKLLVKNIGLLATPEGKSAHRGSEQGKIKFLKDAWVLIEDGVIASVGTGEAPAAEGEMCIRDRFWMAAERSAFCSSVSLGIPKAAETTLNASVSRSITCLLYTSRCV